MASPEVSNVIERSVLHFQKNQDGDFRHQKVGYEVTTIATPVSRVLTYAHTCRPDLHQFLRVSEQRLLVGIDFGGHFFASKSGKEYPKSAQKK